MDAVVIGIGKAVRPDDAARAGDCIRQVKVRVPQVGQVDPVNGVYDITGNVMEWTSNLLCEYPLVEGGSKSCNSNFTATRGAPWDLPGTAPQEVVSTFRSWAPSGYQGPEYGFRCALTY